LLLLRQLLRPERYGYRVHRTNRRLQDLPGSRVCASLEVSIMVRRMRLALLPPSIALAALALAHCGGTNGNAPIPTKNGDASAPPPDDASMQGGGDDAASGTTEAGGGGGDASSIGSGEGGDDAMPAPPPIPVPEAGAPSDPRSVVCGGAPCPVGSGSTCCVDQGADGGSVETCAPPNSPACGGLTIRCNEASDCTGGAVCCQDINGIALPGSTSCMKSCPGIGTETFQACRTDAECGGLDAGSLMRCVPRLCTNTVPKRTLTIESCAVPATIADPNGGDGTLAYCAPL
jgi:hypothetical protein